MTDRMGRLVEQGVRCTRCGAPWGGCECWERCHCGQTKARGELCENPVHEIEKAAETLAADVVERVLADLRRAYPDATKGLSAGYKRTLKTVMQREVRNAMRDVLLGVNETEKTQSHG